MGCLESSLRITRQVLVAVCLFQNLSALFPFWSRWGQMFQAVCLKMSYGDAAAELLNEIENFYIGYKEQGPGLENPVAVAAWDMEKAPQCDFYLGKNAEWDSEFGIPVLQRNGLRAIEDGLPVTDRPVDNTAAGGEPEQPQASRAETPNKMRAPAVVVSSPAARGSGYVKRGPATYAANHKRWRHSRHNRCSPNDRPFVFTNRTRLKIVRFLGSSPLSESSPSHLLRVNAEETLTQMAMDAWYPGHPNKVSVQIGDYPNQENRPVVTRSIEPSFLSWEEYVTLLGYGLIYKHEYVAGLMKSLADSIATLKVIEPGDAMRVNFKVEEPESTGMRVVDSLPIASEGRHNPPDSTLGQGEAGMVGGAHTKILNTIDKRGHHTRRTTAISPNPHDPIFSRGYQTKFPSDWDSISEWHEIPDSLVEWIQQQAGLQIGQKPISSKDELLTAFYILSPANYGQSHESFMRALRQRPGTPEEIERKGCLRWFKVVMSKYSDDAPVRITGAPLVVQEALERLNQHSTKLSAGQPIYLVEPIPAKSSADGQQCSSFLRKKTSKDVMSLVSAGAPGGDSQGHLDWRVVRLLCHLSFSPLLDDYYSAADDEADTLAAAIAKSMERGDRGFSHLWWRTTEGSRNMMPLTRLQQAHYLMAECGEAGGRRPHFLIFIHWPMVMWVTEMFLQSIGVRYVTIRAGMGERARREAAAEFTDAKSNIDILLTSYMCGAPSSGYGRSGWPKLGSIIRIATR
ncbi:hypothetical protein CNMCM5623_005441 [Aspergillus felis]|uniref:Uncharacterized protein n=1 Tax=Aspergillus felis TaxID=1287682 RepID=A0A8H6UQS4_9EURO|nr:hypothetical protein CNMCM5623_005441 [Aspergillus felis]